MPAIQHTVLFKMPDLTDDSEGMTQLQGVCAQFNTLPGIQAAFRRAGTSTMTCAELCEELDWPNKTDGFTHNLTVIAEDVKALKGYLHSTLHLEDWIAVAKVYGKGIVVFDSELGVPMGSSSSASASANNTASTADA